MLGLTIHVDKLGNVGRQNTQIVCGINGARRIPNRRKIVVLNVQVVQSNVSQ